MEKKNLSELEWLIGQWEGLQGKEIYQEGWEKVNENEFQGRAYVIKDEEIVNPEKLKIHSDHSGTFYTADVSHNPGPVSFKMTSSGGNKFIFENPEHDFPKKITYEKKDNDSLLATVEAEMDGKVKKFEYSLRRF